MDHNVVSSILTFVTTLFLSILVYFKNRKSPLNKIYALYSFSIAVWSFGFLKMITASNAEEGLFWASRLHFGAIFIPMLYIHVAYTLLNITHQNKKILFIGYTICFILLAICPTSLFVSHAPAKPGFKYFVGPGIFYHFFTIFFFTCVIYSQYKLFKGYRSSSGQKRNQIKYVFIAYLIGYTGGAVAFAPLFNIWTPTWGLYPIPICMLIITYAIIRYKLMDITLVFRNGLVFISYTAIVCIVFLPLAILARISPLFIAVVIILLAVTAPYIHRLLTKRFLSIVDTMVFKRKYDYMDRLEKFIEDMVLIPKEEDLLKNTAKNLTEILGVKKMAIFIFDHVMGDYNLGTQIGLNEIKDFRISGDTGIAAWLKKHREIFMGEELEKILDKDELTPIKETMGGLSAFVCIPVMLETDLLGFITLGEKSSGEMYSHLDTEILRRLGIQLAVALDYKRVETELRKKQEYVAMGQLAFEITHEMKNLLVPINTFIQLLPERMNDSEFINNMSRLSKTNVDAINRKVEDILYFGQEQKLNLSAGLDINKLLSNTAEGLRPLAQKDNIPIVEELGDIPKIIADKGLLLHVFNNLIINAIDAMKSRTGKIRIRTQRHTAPSMQMKQISSRWIRIEVKDDGEGIPDNVKGKIFDAFITTKSGGGMLQKRGMGLGLTIVKKIVDQHHGIVGVNSSVGKGTTFIVDLPVEQRG